jgi:hypothetical protein
MVDTLTILEANPIVESESKSEADSKIDILVIKIIAIK